MASSVESSTSPTPGRVRAETRSGAVAESLLDRLEQGEWSPTQKLPTEHELASAYGVSRATIRTALRTLDSRGLTVTRHGLGTFATAATSAVSANLQRLESISQTIQRLGRVPGANFRSIAVRDATPDERRSLQLTGNAQVLATEREITADGEVVAYSHDALPRAVLGIDFDVRSMTGSLFAVLEHHGVSAVSALTELHASQGNDMGWSGRPPDALYLMLEQTHFDASGRSVAYSRTWFVEGRFQFNLIRVR
ncbi:MAG: GntR family transcriptional regulator [Ilumatobacteraceae bacterium]